MNTEEKIEIVKKYLKQKICFGLKVTDSEVCKHCHLTTQCAPMREARLVYEERQLEMAATKSEVDAAFEARMESMSKAKFEAMLAKALNRQVERKAPAGHPTAPHKQQDTKHQRAVEHAVPASNAMAPDEQQDAIHNHEPERKAPPGNATATNAQQIAKVVTVKGKGRPRTAKDKSAQVLTMEARGMTRQAIASELGISLASVYRILKENR